MDLTTLLNKLPKVSVDMHVEENTSKMLHISLRDGVSDEPSQNTILAAKAIINYVNDRHKEIRVRYEIVDEWIDITFTDY